MRKSNLNISGFTLIELLVVIVVVGIISGIVLPIILFFFGDPPIPYDPRTEYSTYQEVIVKPIQANTVKLRNGPLFKQGDKVAVFSFSSPNVTQGGALVSDMFSSVLQEKGYQVVERT